MKKIKNIHESYKKIISYILLFFFLLLLSGCGVTQKSNEYEEYGENGKIAFLWYPEDKDSVGKLILMDGNGNQARSIGLFSGSLAFSPDGKQIAIGCPTINQYEIDYKQTDICLLDIDKIVSFTHKRLMDHYDLLYSDIARISLPEQCQQYKEWNGELYEGLHSIDWSPKVDKLILVCGDRQNSEVCIINLNGDSHCWNDDQKQAVFRAVWSPVDENIVLVSGWQYSYSEIYLATTDGEIIQKLEPGWSAEWSPDGKKIAYIEYMVKPQTQGHSYGIAVINKDGTNHQYYYLPEDTKSVLYLDEFGTIIPTRLAWSPDGQYITISGMNMNMYYGLFRLDINSGDIFRLVDTGIFHGVLYEPDWAP